jgi:methionyl-tRNA formyltransferase
MFEQNEYYICCSKLWITDIAVQLTTLLNKKFHLIQTKEELNNLVLNSKIKKTIFFPHWSYILKEDVYSKHDCIMFHMTDLPFGRGGSPLQNLIIRGHKTTKISAFLCDGGIDTGPVFMKETLHLTGKAQDIFKVAQQIMILMIVEIVTKKISPTIQTGKVTEFKRRTPEMGDLALAENVEQIYDMIRMLDADGYPRAFLKNDVASYFFENAQFDGTEIIAEVRIRK